MRGDNNHSMNSFSRNDTNMSNGSNGDLVSSNSSVSFDDSMDIITSNGGHVNDKATKIIQRRMTVAVDQSFASSSTSNQPPQNQSKRLLKTTPFGRQSSLHSIHSMISLARNDTNVEPRDNSNSGNGSNVNGSAKNNADLVSSNSSVFFDNNSMDIVTSNGENVNDSSGNQLISFDNEEDFNSSMDVVANNSSYVVPLILDRSIPATSIYKNH